MRVDSARYAVIVAALAAVCAIPVWLRTFAADAEDPCSSPALVFDASRIGGAGRVAWAEAPERRVDASIDGTLDVGTQLPLRVRVLRTYEPHFFAGSPKSVSIERMLYLQPAEWRVLESRGTELPVHWMSERTSRYVRFEGYLYAYDARPTLHPVSAALRHAVEQLVHGTRPHYLLIASGYGTPAEAPRLERAAEQWFADAWEQVSTACARPVGR